MLRRSGGSRHSTMPNFLKTGPSIAEILQFFEFSRWPLPPIFYFWNHTILSANGVQRIKTHERAGDIKIFRFCKMAAAAISDCRIRKILLVDGDGVWRAQTHHNTKFCQNWSFHCRDITIFQIFKMASASILYFWNCKILLAIGVQKVETHQNAKLCQNRSIGCKDNFLIIKTFWLFKMAAVRHLGFVWGHIWTTNSEYLRMSIILKNLVMIDEVVFVIWTFQYLAHLGGKCLFTPPKLGF